MSFETLHRPRSKGIPGYIRLSLGSLQVDNGSAVVLHPCPWDIGAMVRFQPTAHFNNLLAEMLP